MNLDYSLINKNTYEILADEYESRVDCLLPVTEDAITYFASHLKPSGEVLDVGCAVGVAVSVLNKKGFKVSGIEISPSMAEYAKKRNPDTNIIIGDFLKTNFKKDLTGFWLLLSYTFFLNKKL